MVDVFKKILDSLEFYIFAGVFFIIIWYFVLSPRAIDGISMYPYLQNNDFILVYKLQYLSDNPQRGDVVVFKHSETQDYIKRVIATPGETVMVQNGKVYVDGKELYEVYLDSAVRTQPGATLREGVAYKVPENQFVLMGDNRQYSTDSREFGAIPKEYIEGRAVVVWFPPEEAKLIKRLSYGDNLMDNQ
ncbi:MAG: signal peptidase I [Candidatus Dojkabacteria bacterium]|nr:MAG: signal peptidase I [Candidatus Dojkabacteria bacterium]